MSVMPTPSRSAMLANAHTTMKPSQSRPTQQGICSRAMQNLPHKAFPIQGEHARKVQSRRACKEGKLYSCSMKAKMQGRRHQRLINS
uniref:Uncharacterized protein n=1 Tax=Arundo donax TaxID=35708 RepID=A0A0A9GGG3_ARUDO